jgi:catechol 2,3-dioxygenase-like lactoylglutathione lyase family enzyme
MDKPLKLGYAFEIVDAVPNVKQSLRFYEQLGYQKVSESDSPAPHAMLTDGTIRLSLREGSEWKTTLTYYVENLAERVAAFEQRGVKFDNKSETDGKVAGATLTDPNGLEVNLVEAAPAEIYQPPGAPISAAGQFGELSIETEDIQGSLDFWMRLGFEPTQYMPNPPVSWGSIADGLLMLGIYGKGHCPHIIRTPSITYFEADMAERIRNLKQEGMTFLQELPGENGETGHAVAEAPEGQLLFLFGF